MNYKVLIVDDNYLFRRSLNETINWSSLNCLVVGEADNGVHGLELARKLSPHIVITDIKMPGMDGLDFSLKLREISPSVKIILISGFGEFEYAQTAIKLGAHGYLLKPIQNEDVYLAVGSAIDALQREMGARTISHMDDGDLPNLELSPKESLSILKQIAADICVALEACSKLAHTGKGTASRAEITAAVDNTQNLSEISDYIEEHLRTLKENMADGMLHPVVAKIMEQIDKYYAMDVTLQSAAETFFLNSSYLSRLLRKETGKSFTELLSERRMQAAKELLKNPKNRVIDVAAAVGYKEYVSFYNAFKKVVGISPNEYKKLL